MDHSYSVNIEILLIHRPHTPTTITLSLFNVFLKQTTQ